MHELLSINYIDITLAVALQVILLGFIGGILSGFIGSGGAFFMTPGMMNLGVGGVVAVASNITHKFGKAMVGARKHAAAGNVDKKLAAFMLATALVGVQIAVWINSFLFKGGVVMVMVLPRGQVPTSTSVWSLPSFSHLSLSPCCAIS